MKTNGEVFEVKIHPEMKSVLSTNDLLEIYLPEEVSRCVEIVNYSIHQNYTPPGKDL